MPGGQNGPPASPPSKPAAKGKKKKLNSPTKKYGLKADYGGVYFGHGDHATSRLADGSGSEEVHEVDPLATYRAAAAAAKVAAVKEAKEDAQEALFRKLFVGMDTNGDGKVDLGEVMERVAASTAPLSQRATSSRREGAIALQLPTVFGYQAWMKEMKRVSKAMDEAAFEANVLAMFACFDGAAAEPAQPRTVVRPELLRQVFDAMDTDKDGRIDLDDFLLQEGVQDGVEEEGAVEDELADELSTLFTFFASLNGDGTPRQATCFDGKGYLTFEQFANGTLTRTPLGRVRTDKMFESAVRGMMADIAKCLARRAGTAPATAPVSAAQAAEVT